ncbi:MAG TPA: hypothetical protein VFY10_09195, partial [Dehalococcoidia bacterium]|nr:hypothetical protein [Dehalococcoidia bacterium]
MRKHKLVRFAGFAVAGLLALGAIGYAANGGFSSKSHDATNTPAGDEFAIEGVGGSDSIGTTGVDSARPSIAPAPPLQDGVTSSALKSGGKTAASGAGSNGASVATAAPAPSAPRGDALAATTDRKIVQTASMALQVKDVGGSFEDVGRIATGAGGYVA